MDAHKYTPIFADAPAQYRTTCVLCSGRNDLFYLGILGTKVNVISYNTAVHENCSSRSAESVCKLNVFYAVQDLFVIRRT